MPEAMEFGLLGPLVVRSGETEIPVRRGHPRALLAILLLAANRPVSVEAITEALWGSAPPRSAPVAVRSYIRVLRLALGQAGRERISTQPRGYLIRVADGELDLARFEHLHSSALSAARSGSWPEAAGQAREALSCWRGEPLADIEAETLVQREAPRLRELRLQAAETRIDADLRLGRHAEVTAELQQLSAAHPLREHPQALLMLALYRCGRQAEALAAYQRVRAVLVEELGADPGTELQALHQRILRSDPALAAPQPGSGADPGAPPAGAARAEPVTAGAMAPVVPRQLPAAVGCFTGRDAELTALTALVAAAPAARPPVMVISAIGGTAGVGKTALAVQWAHQVAERFPDGQLYVNLRGYDPGQPVAAADALAGFLRALGVPGTDIPDRAEDRARLYRSKLAGRRVLALLDNARDGEQVRPLLPSEPGCVAVVTSRDTLAGLVAIDGARRLDLDVLPLADADALLRSLIGARADADPEAAAALAGLCARLPLALRIAAELAAARREVPLAELVAELAASRLDGLDAGEDRADVRAVFSWSVRQLPDDAAGAFALVSLHPGADLDVHACAALTGTTRGDARQALGRLHRASLLQAAGPGRYGMHDLLRAYAREQAAARDADGWCRQALTGMFDFYLSAAASAMDILYPAEAHRRPRISVTAAVVPEMGGQADARAWLDRERANLVAVVVHCAGRGWPQHAAGLAATLHRYLITGSHLPELHTVHGHVLQAARRSGDLAAEASALNGFGSIAVEKGHYREAAGHYRDALERYRRCGDRAGQARAVHNLGIAEHYLHDYQSAVGHYREATAGYEDTGDRLGVAGALCGLAGVETELGCYAQASEHLQSALQVFRDEKDKVREAEALMGIGEVNLCRGQLTQAAGLFEQALAVYRATGQASGVASALSNLGGISLRQGTYQQAISYLRQALALFRQSGYQHGESVTLSWLAEALDASGQPAAARAQLATALRLAAETGGTYQQARVHRDLAESHHRAGQDEQARHHWQQALSLFSQLDAPEADQIRRQLTAASPG
jgi:DNA-binding SARP family transcriptional activator/tetratricopeptide (TPR) repeat protein